MLQFKNARRSLWLVALVSLCVSDPRVAFALSGKMESAGNLPLSSSLSGDARQSIRAALDSEASEFLAGSFVNSKSTMSFAGETASLNAMIDALAHSPGVTVFVRFQKFDDVSDWQVAHNAFQNEFQIAINLNSKQIDLTNLEIPAAKGRDHSSATRK